MLARQTPTPHYRSMAVHDLCVWCRAEAPQACRRCASPLCERHLPQGDNRCPHCEQDFRRSHEKAELDVLYVISAIVLTAAASTYLLFALAPITLQSFALATASCLGIPPLLIWRKFRRVRRRFLAHQKRPTLRLGEAEASSAVGAEQSGYGTTQ